MWTTLRQIRDDPDRVQDQVARRYRRPIYDFAMQQGLGHEDAEDVTQEVFIRICQQGFLERADETKGRFRTLLLAVTKHVIASFRRHELAAIRDRRRDVPLGDFQIPVQPPSDTEFDKLWVANLVEQAIGHLKDDPTIPAFRLWMKKKSYAEIAIELRRKVSDVTNHVHRARTRIAREIERMIEEYSSAEEVPEEIEILREFLRKDSPE